MNRTNWRQKTRQPDRLLSYFKMEKIPLAVITISGLVYNVGMVAGPYFEGQLAQCLLNIMQKTAVLGDMLILAAVYLCTILLVQGMRCIKRFYVRRFANDISGNMRHMLYNSLVHMSRKELDEEGMGSIMTKAVADVDACVEGMRKFTTEVFDTGVVLIAYLVMLFIYDYRLTLLSCVFTAAAYVLAEKLKVVVTRYHSAYKRSAGILNGATMDRVSHAVTYRVYGRETKKNEEYEEKLKDYEKKAVQANIWENTMQPVYHVISMLGVIFIIYFGGRNVLGNGWTVWNIAAFTTYLSCFAKMALKSSKAAKLFNAVQKARVSYFRIKPLLKEYIDSEEEQEDLFTQRQASQNNVHYESESQNQPVLTIQDVSFGYEPGKELIRHFSMEAEAGQIIGITGAVASGKSTFGRMFLCEEPYQGSIRIDSRELRDLSEYERSKEITYMGHNPQLMSDTMAENILLGKNCGTEEILENLLKQVCLDQDLRDMGKTPELAVGSGGHSLSGGQQARVALARTICHGGRVWILDDPFSAVDKKTETILMEHLRHLAEDKIILLISHRLTHFPQLNQILFMSGESIIKGTHEELLQNGGYRNLYEAQLKGGDRV